jgi:hypothetical protein
MINHHEIAVLTCQIHIVVEESPAQVLQSAVEISL